MNRFGVIAIALSALLITACTNGQNVIGQGVGSTTSAATSPTNDTIGTSFVQLQRVIIDPNTAGILDLEGDGSNAIGNVCTAATSTTGASTTNYQGSGASNCECQFTWTLDQAGTIPESAQVNTSYYEANMLECPYNQIPAGAYTPMVAIYNSTTQQTSNFVSVPLSGAGAAVDLTNAINFAQMNRYQCKDIVTIMMPWADGQPSTAANVMYDPFQSSNPDVSYPLNFYTSNFGDTFSQISQSQISNWSCPGLPNDPSVPGLDLRVWSLASDTYGSNQIYPTQGNDFDRSTFYVSKQSAGLFNIPINTYIAPTLYGGNGTLPPSGYGAAAVPTGSGTGASETETCPTTTQVIPAGFQWVKLWLFRAGLNGRTFSTSQALESTNIQCNPGLDSGGTTPLFNDCGPASGNAADPLGGVYFGMPGSPAPAAPGVFLADRIISGEGSPLSQNAVCVNIDGSSVAGGFSCALNETYEGPGCWTGTETTARYPAGTDEWKTRQNTAQGKTGGPQTANLVVTVDPLNLYVTSSGGTNVAGTTNVPVDVNPGSQPLDVVNGVEQPRYDFLFVVTPMTVMSGQMNLSTASSLNYPYTPVRFPSKQDCQSSNYLNPSFSGDCNPSKIIHYGIVQHDVSNNGDPPANDPSDPPLYPVCVLQPI